MSRKFNVLFSFLCVLLFISTASAHSGNIDKDGVHWDMKTDTYHRHENGIEVPAIPAPMTGARAYYFTYYVFRPANNLSAVTSVPSQETVINADGSNARPTGPTTSVPSRPAQELVSSEYQNITVYVTETGDRYHRDGCQYLHSSKYAISLENARHSYYPCSRCNPPR